MTENPISDTQAAKLLVCFFGGLTLIASWSGPHEAFLILRGLTLFILVAYLWTAK